MVAVLNKKADMVKSISAREVWKNEDTIRIEEKCMSPFIVEHLDEISNITGYDLEMTNMELYVGDFRADIVCKDNNTGDVIVIENQLEHSDHDHIGKAITYLANLDAKGIIWICEDVRLEHLKAIEKLNEITGDEYNFYCLELKFEKYNNDPCYYYFKERVVSSAVNKLANRLKNASEGFIEVTSFFEKFIEELKETVPTARIIKGKSYHQIYKRGTLYAWIGRSTKNLDSLKIEIGYDEMSLPKNANKKEYKEKFEIIKNILNSKGYNYIYESGKKNSNIHKLILNTEFNNDNIDVYKDACTVVYETLINNWKD